MVRSLRGWTSPHLRCLRLGLLMAVVSLALSGALEPPFARAEASESPYQALVREAIEEFDHGNWDEAYGLFVQAHALRPNARTLRGMGFAALEARRYVRARRHLQDALSEVRSALTKQQRVDVEKALVTADRFIGHVQLIHQPEGARVSVDGREAERADDGSLLLDPGTHELVVEAGGERVRSSLELFAGERRTLELTWPSQEPTAAAPQSRSEAVVAPAQAAPPVEPVRARGQPGRALRHGGYALVGVAVLFAGGAVGMHVLAQRGDEQVRDACGEQACSPTKVDDEIAAAHISTYQNLAIAGWSLAGAAVVGASTLFWLARRKQRAGADLAFGPQGAGLSLKGRF